MIDSEVSVRARPGDPLPVMPRQSRAQYPSASAPYLEGSGSRKISVMHDSDGKPELLVLSLIHI